MTSGYVPAGYFPSGNVVLPKYVWPDPEPVGPVMKPLSKLAELIASLPTFRVACGLSESDPLGSDKLLEGLYGHPRRIFYPEVDWDSFLVVPSVVIQIGDEWEAQASAGGAYQSTRPRGNLRIIPIMPDDYPDDVERSMRTYTIYLGNFFNEMREQFARSDAFAGDTLRQVHPPVLPTVETVESTQNSYWRSVWMVNWSA